MKSKLLPTLLILLIILNGVLIFMLVKKPHENRQKHPQRNFLTTQLNFSETQKEEFRKLDRIHRGLMFGLDQEIRENRAVLFNSFSIAGFNPEMITAKNGVLEEKKEMELFRFFSEVRKICTIEQTSNFDKIIMKALRGNKEKPPRKEGKHNLPKGERRLPPPR
jgi:hypothetical protein